MEHYKPIYKPVPTERLPIEKIDILDKLVPNDPHTTCHAFILKNVISPAECKQLIDAAEKIGFYEPGNSRMLRVMADDVPFSQVIFDRIKDYLPKKVENRYGKSETMLGLNTRWRCGRYVKNDYFHVHADSTYSEDIEGTNLFSGSVLTVMLYLNSHEPCANLPTFVGGATEFTTHGKRVKYSVAPEPGLALIFTQEDDDMLHRGELVTSGTKYILRSDAMYEFPRLIRFRS
jgi:hypothetical protein